MTEPAKDGVLSLSDIVREMLRDVKLHRQRNSIRFDTGREIVLDGKKFDIFLVVQEKAAS